MADYHELNIYKKIYDFLIYYGQILKHFPREYRYTLGEKILDNMFELALFVYDANSDRKLEDRQLTLKKMELKLQYVNITLRLSHSLKCISNERYAKCSEFEDNISKQLMGWINYTEKLLNKEKDKELCKN